VIAAAWAQSAGQGRDWPPSERPPGQDRHDEAGAARDEARMREREQRRRSPEAKRERERSRTAYVGNSVDPRGLARRKFGGVFREPVWQGPRLRRGERIRAYLSQDSFLVDRPRGADLLVEALAPIVYKDSSGKRRPIKTRLRSAGAAVRPASTPSGARIARDAAGGVALPRSGFKFRLAAAAGSAEVDEDKAFFANALEDTDLAIAALPDGVAALLQLRSAASPEAAELDFDLPPGASLRVNRATRGGPSARGDGVEIVKGGSVLATVAAPEALDADRQPVPVGYDVADDKLTIRIPHRDGDWRYPLLVDPYVTENYLWHNTPTDRNRWDYGYSQGGFVFHDCTPADRWYCDTGTGLSGRGLYVEAPPQGYFDGARGEWYWQAPHGSSIVRVDWHFGHTARNSCVYAHILGPNDQKQGSVVDWCGDIVPAQWGTSCTGHPNGCTTANSSPGNWAIFGLRMRNGTFWSAWAQLRNAQIALWEAYRPTATAISPEPATGWVDRYQHSFSATGKDPGLGLKRIVFGPGPDPLLQERELGCAGDRTNPCPKDPETATLPVPGDPKGPYRFDTTYWPEGKHVIELVAVDVIGNPSEGTASLQRTIKVDHNPPTLTPSGTLPQEDGRVVTGPAYTLGGTADDPHAGAETIKIFVNDGSGDVEQGQSPPPCSGDGCSTTRPLWTFAPSRDGLYTITLRATDKLGHPTEKVYRVIVDRDRPSLSVTHSGLSSAWTTAASITTTEHGSDAGSGVQVAELVLPRATRRENFATCTGEVASRCPTSDSQPFDYSDADLDEGTNTVTGRVYDAIGRPSDPVSWEVKIDKFPPRLDRFTGAMAKPEGWVNDTSLTVDTSDSGSGVARSTIEIDRPGGPADTKTNKKADGVTPCDAQSGCAPTLSHAYAPPLADGIHQVDVTGVDAVGRSVTDNWPVKLDRTSPSEPVVSGEIATDGKWIGPDDRGLHVSATDGLSGVKSIELHVDGVRHGDPKEADCGDTCPSPFAADFDWDHANVAEGSHTLKVIARDFAGNTSERTWTVHIDDTAPSSIITGSLWELDGEFIGDPKQLHIEAYEGETGFAESGLARIEVIAEDRRFSTESACTTASCGLEMDWTLNPADYPEGELPITIEMTDRAGNVAIHELTVFVRHFDDPTSQQIDLDTAPSLRIYGAAAGDAAGHSIATLGDVDGDGLTDYAIGAPGVDGPAGPDAGAVFVVWGDAGVTTVDLAQVHNNADGSPGPLGFHIDGASLGDRARSSVSSAGDVNGDGRTDLVLGAPKSLPLLAGVTVNPSVAVVFGRPRSASDDVQLSSLGSRGFVVGGPPLGVATASDSYPPSPFGAKVAGATVGEEHSAGDVNGDGRDDIVIGSSTELRTGPDSGAVYVIFGRAATTPVNVATDTGWGYRVDGLPGQRLGYSVALPGDVDNDGLADPVAGAPGHVEPGRNRPGAAYVLFGKSDSSTIDLAAGTGGRTKAIVGRDSDSLGYSVSGLGDVDGDRLDDYAVGGHNAYALYGDASTAHVDLTSASLPLAGWRMIAPGAGPEFDTGVVSRVGDMDGDQRPDVTVGYPDAADQRTNNGRSYTVMSRPMRFAEVNLGALEANHGAELVGARDGDRSGSSSAGVDATGDGSRGQATGSPGAARSDGSMSGAGRSDVTRRYAFRSEVSGVGVKDPEYPVSTCYQSKAKPFFWPRDYLEERPRDKPFTTPPCRKTAYSRAESRIYYERPPKSHRRAPRGTPSDDPMTGQNARRGNRAPINPGAWPLRDSFGRTFACVENAIPGVSTGKRKDRWRVLRAINQDCSPPGDEVGRTRDPRAPALKRGWELMIQGTTCMSTAQLENEHTLVVLKIVDEKRRRTAPPTEDDVGNPGVTPDASRNVDLGIRGFIPYGALPPSAYRTDEEVRRNRDPDLHTVSERAYVGCGKFRNYPDELAQPIDEDGIGRLGFSRNERTQGSGSPVRCAQARTRPEDCGGTYFNYERPIFFQNAEDDGFDVLVPASSSPSTNGGGIASAIVRDGTRFRELDRIGYVDENVPCTREFVATWIFGDFNPEPQAGERHIYGWLPIRTPTNRFRNGAARRC
jgi:hypothetical protein